MISNVLSDIRSNFLLLPGMSTVDFRAYPEAKEEQPGARRVLMYPFKSLGMGPDIIFTQPQQPAEIRQRFLVYEAQCWGIPDPTGNLIKNTDDTENILQALIVAVRKTVRVQFRFLDESWNQRGEVMMYGRCVVAHFEIRTPVPNIDIETEVTTLGDPGFTITPALETAA